jgi:hypothetical protein
MSLRILSTATVVALSAFVSTAEASPLLYDITFNPTPDVFFDNQGGTCTGSTTTSVVTGQTNSACLSLGFTYTLGGFDPVTDTLASGSLVLRFYDDPGDPGSGGQPESLTISFGGVPQGGELTILQQYTQANPFSPSFDVRASLQTNGTLAVLLSLGPTNLGNNDFFFASSQLTARGERNEGSSVTPVPEPASLALFGIALTAVAMRLRARVR